MLKYQKKGHEEVSASAKTESKPPIMRKYVDPKSLLYKQIEKLLNDTDYSALSLHVRDEAF